MLSGWFVLSRVLMFVVVWLFLHACGRFVCEISMGCCRDGANYCRLRTTGLCLPGNSTIPAVYGIGRVLMGLVISSVAQYLGSGKVHVPMCSSLLRLASQILASCILTFVVGNFSSCS